MRKWLNDQESRENRRNGSEKGNGGERGPHNLRGSPASRGRHGRVTCKDEGGPTPSFESQELVLMQWKPLHVAPTAPAEASDRERADGVVGITGEGCVPSPGEMLGREKQQANTSEWRTGSQLKGNKCPGEGAGLWVGGTDFRRTCGWGRSLLGWTLRAQRCWLLSELRSYAGRLCTGLLCLRPQGQVGKKPRVLLLYVTMRKDLLNSHRAHYDQ